MILTQNVLCQASTDLPGIFSRDKHLASEMKTATETLLEDSEDFWWMAPYVAVMYTDFRSSIGSPYVPNLIHGTEYFISRPEIGAKLLLTQVNSSEAQILSELGYKTHTIRVIPFEDEETRRENFPGYVNPYRIYALKRLTRL